jgi:HicB-like protein involved in pilus formation
MDLDEYTEMLRREVASVTRFGGEELARTAEMLADALESSVRLTLLEVLTAAAAEITTRLDGAVIDVRLSGGEPEFVVTTTTGEPAGEPDEPADPGSGDASDDMTRITLRLSGPLKAKVDAAAAAAGLSVNAWLVRAVSRALDAPSGGPPRSQRGPGIGSRYRGYARG